MALLSISGEKIEIFSQNVPKLFQNYSLTARTLSTIIIIEHMFGAALFRMTCPPTGKVNKQPGSPGCFFVPNIVLHHTKPSLK
jgi:hypothetical protein